MSTVRSSTLLKILYGIDLSPAVEPYAYDVEKPTQHTEKLSYAVLKALAAFADNNGAVEILQEVQETEPGQTKQGLIDALLGMMPGDIPAVWAPVVEVILPAVLNEAVETALSPVDATKEMGLALLDSVVDFALGVVRDIIYEKWIVEHPELPKPPKPGAGECDCESIVEQITAIRQALDAAISRERVVRVGRYTIGESTEFVDFANETPEQ